jgi:hypothetical protein
MFIRQGEIIACPIFAQSEHETDKFSGLVFQILNIQIRSVIVTIHLHTPMESGAGRRNAHGSPLVPHLLHAAGYATERAQCPFRLHVPGITKRARRDPAVADAAPRMKTSAVVAL